LHALAVRANPRDEHAVPDHLEVVALGHLVADPLKGLALELDELIADLAVEVVVVGIAVVVLENATAAQRHLLEESCFDELDERAVDGRPTDAALDDQLGQVRHEFVGVEVVVVAENLLDDQPTLVREPLAARLKELAEPFRGRLGYVNVPK
jgi:hypothetical protein